MTDEGTQFELAPGGPIQPFGKRPGRPANAVEPNPYYLPPQARIELQEKLELLRAWNPALEFPIFGYHDISAYLRSLGIRNWHGVPIQAQTVRQWVRKRGLPVFYLKQSHVAQTTNYLIQAWMWSFTLIRERRYEIIRNWKRTKAMRKHLVEEGQTPQPAFQTPPDPTTIL